MNRGEKRNYREQKKSILNLLAHLNQRFGISIVDSQIELLKVFSQVDRIYEEAYQKEKADKKALKEKEQMNNEKKTNCKDCGSAKGTDKYDCKDCSVVDENTGEF